MIMDRKHANIGATVSLLLNIHKLTPDKELPTALANLFTEESDDCDYKRDNACKFISAKTVKPGTVPCIIGNCPLGALIDKIANDQGFPTITNHAKTLPFKQRLACGFVEEGRTFGDDPDNMRVLTQGGNIHIGYTGWRKTWSFIKRTYIFGWPTYFAEWLQDVIDNWKFYTVIAIVILLVIFGSKLAGMLSIYVF
jgi:hypothetical protein